MLCAMTAKRHRVATTRAEGTRTYCRHVADRHPAEWRFPAFPPSISASSLRNPSQAESPLPRNRTSASTLLPNQSSRANQYEQLILRNPDASVALREPRRQSPPIKATISQRDPLILAPTVRGAHWDIEISAPDRLRRAGSGLVRPFCVCSAARRTPRACPA